MSQGPTHRSRTKNVDFTMALARDYIQRGRAVMEHCPTAEQIADMCTKQLWTKQSLRCLQGSILGLVPFLRC
jgi:hypothetical protein